MAGAYDEAYRRSRSEPERFWLEAAASLHWHTPPTRALDAAASPTGRWFVDGQLNTCFNVIDRHVQAGRGGQPALIYDSPLAGRLERYTYAELREEVARTAGLLRRCGVGVGDRVVIYMPMIPQAVFAMLACARLGAVHSVVFGGFAAGELAKRIDDARPKLVLSASCGLEPGRIVPYKSLLDEALAIAGHDVSRRVIWQRPEQRAVLSSDRDVDWADALAAAEPAECVPVAATDPLYILYTSGTTGAPKGIVRDNGGHAVALAWSMANVYGVRPGEVFWAASDIGWVVGHSYIVYGPLLQGCTTILYEGKPVGTPDPGAFWRVIRDHGVDVFFTAPTALRAVKREDPEGRFIATRGTGRLRALFLAGERADPDTVRWAEERLRVPVIDHWWQTELGWPALATCLGLGCTTTRYGSAGRAVPGFEFAVLDAAGHGLPAGATGDIAIKLPLPPGCLPGLWRDEAGFRRAYLETHPGYYTTGDAGFQDGDGYVHVMSRTDDIINVAGHRLSTGAIEQVLASHAAIAECAVFGAADSIKGMVPVALVVPKAGVARAHETIVAELIRAVREQIGPVAALKSIVVVKRLPKTRSGKILRGVMRAIADGQPYRPPATIEDESTLGEVHAALRSIGYARHAGDVDATGT